MNYSFEIWLDDGTKVCYDVFLCMHVGFKFECEVIMIECVMMLLFEIYSLMLSKSVLFAWSQMYFLIPICPFPMILFGFWFPLLLNCLIITIHCVFCLNWNFKWYIWYYSSFLVFQQIPLSHISEDVYKTSVDWIGKQPSEALGSFVLWSLDNILGELITHHAAAKGSKKAVQQASSKSQVALRSDPAFLIQLCCLLHMRAWCSVVYFNSCISTALVCTKL